MEISIYLKSTGQIVQTRSVSGPEEIHLTDDYGYIEGKFPVEVKKWNGSEVVDYTPPYVAGTNEIYIREKRNLLLASTDWTQVPDSPLSDSEKAQWATFRQKLRDLLDGYVDSESNTIDTLNWPVPPNLPNPPE